ncbi:MAG: iron complex outermembrane receptor protein, partial [Glaciecola sp.]
MTNFKQSLIALSIASVLSAGALAQEVTQAKAEEKSGLETITVTAQKRSESIQDVPLSIATLSGESFENIFSGGDDILALSTRIPGLYA